MGGSGGRVRDDIQLKQEFFNFLKIYIGFEVLTAVVMKSFIFWGVMSCSQLKVSNIPLKH
jgi:hypothetical protein